MNSDFAEMIVDYIKNMRIGDSNSIGAIVKNVFNKELSVDELFDIQDIVMQKCEEQGIICDYSKNDGSVVGLPFNLDFIIKEKLNFNKELDIKVWNKESKEKLAKKIYIDLGQEVENMILTRIEGINIDICSPTDSQRGISAILIGDDGSYLVCGSIKSIDSYIEDYKNGNRSNLNEKDTYFKKKNESDIIWWVHNPEEFGKHEFSFDKIKIYNLFRDYPHELSDEEIEIFDRENPYWADYFKNRKQKIKDNEIEDLNKEIDYYKSSIEDHFEKIEKESNDRQIKLNKIKSMFFENDEEYFNSISPYLIETFDSDILINPTDTCVRFELCDIAKNKKIFFAINKNMFLLNDRHKHKLSLRGNSSEERIIYLIKELKNVTSSWHLNYTDVGEYYWGLTICSDNNCSLYVGKSISVDNWNEFITLINETVKDLLNNAIKDTFI